VRPLPRPLYRHDHRVLDALLPVARERGGSLSGFDLEGRYCFAAFNYPSIAAVGEALETTPPAVAGVSVVAEMAAIPHYPFRVTFAWRARRG